MELMQALASLDHDDESQWTEGGSPRMDVLKELTDNSELTRAEVIEAAPGFQQGSPMEVEDGEEDQEEAQEEVTVDEDQIDLDELDIRKMSTKKFAAMITTFGHEDLIDTLALVREDQSQLERDIESLMRLRKHHGMMKVLTQQAMKRTGVHETPQQAIQTYIKRSNQVRAGKVSDHKKAMSNINPRMLNPKSPLDQAMGHRKAIRGSKRPQRG